MSGLFGGGGKNNSAPPTIAGIKVQTSAYGSCIPLVYGTARIAGNLFWYNDFVATPHTAPAAGGGKGGGSPPGQTSYTYAVAMMLGLCEGQCTGVGLVWQEKSLTSLGNLGFSYFSGSSSQAAYSYVTTKHPTEALTYHNLSYVAASNYNLGSSSSVPNHNFEVQALFPYSGAGDADPSVIVSDYLTSPAHGVGFPSAKIGSLTGYQNYCIASGLLLSPAYTKQEQASGALTRLMLATNSAIFSSEGLLKVVPYGDQTVGITNIHGTYTYTPNVTPVYVLTDDDFISEGGGDDPVRVSCKNPADSFNCVQVKYPSRSNQYNDSVVEAKDEENIRVYGLRTMPLVTMEEICDDSAAKAIAHLMLQRALNLNKTYKFTLGWKYLLLEPMDIVILNENGGGTGLQQVPVRITSVEESEDGNLNFEAEDFLGQVGSHALYPTQGAIGFAPDYNVSPGNTNAPLLIEAPSAASDSGFELWAALSGGADWAGCEVWIATNSAGPFIYAGSQYGPARYGVINANLAAGGDPDTVNTCSVDLSTSGGELTSGSNIDADLYNTLAYVGGEFISYANVNLTSANHYDLKSSGGAIYLRRGLYGTANAAHLSGVPFARIDDAIFKYAYDETLIGKTIYVKCLSFNQYGNAKQDISTVTATSYVLAGPSGNPAVVNGLTATGGVLSNTLAWTIGNPGHTTIDRTEIWASTTNNRAGATLIDSVPYPGTVYTHIGLSPNQTWYYWIRSVDIAGNFSAWYPVSATAGVSATTSYVTSAQLAAGAATIISSVTAAGQITVPTDGSPPSGLYLSVASLAIATDPLNSANIDLQFSAGLLSTGSTNQSPFGFTLDKMEFNAADKWSAGSVVSVSSTGLITFTGANLLSYPLAFTNFFFNDGRMYAIHILTNTTAQIQLPIGSFSFPPNAMSGSYFLINAVPVNFTSGFGVDAATNANSAVVFNGVTTTTTAHDTQMFFVRMTPSTVWHSTDTVKVTNPAIRAVRSIR